MSQRRLSRGTVSTVLTRAWDTDGTHMPSAAGKSREGCAVCVCVGVGGAGSPLQPESISRRHLKQERYQLFCRNAASVSTLHALL